MDEFREPVEPVRTGGLAAIVPERRLYLRSDRRTRYLRLSPGAQLSAVLMAALLAGWSVVATGGFLAERVAQRIETLRHAATESALESRLAQVEAERDALATRLAAAQARAAAATGRLAETQDRLVAAETTLAARTRALDEVRGEIGRLAGARRAAEAEAETASAVMDDIEAALQRSRSRAADRDDAVAAMASTLERVIAERDAAVALTVRLDGEIAELEATAARREETRRIALARLSEAARHSLGKLNAILDAADIDIDGLLAAVEPEGLAQGGPFTPLPAAVEADLGERARERFAALMTDLERTNLLRVAVDRLPFGQPVRAAKRTSSFGKRRDPFRGRWSMHNGVDFAAPRGTPILATASGVVRFSGRMRGYGNIVIVQHAFGYETRFAHLSRSLVKVGQRVRRGEVIAEMGSTGRSTGSHLHYEVRVDEVPIDPDRFMVAARGFL